MGKRAPSRLKNPQYTKTTGKVFPPSLYTKKKEPKKKEPREPSS